MNETHLSHWLDRNSTIYKCPKHSHPAVQLIELFVQLKILIVRSNTESPKKFAGDEAELIARLDFQNEMMFRKPLTTFVIGIICALNSYVIIVFTNVIIQLAWAV